MHKEQEDSLEDRDTSNDPKFCCCFSMKCGVIFIGIYIIIDLILCCLFAYYISQNEYFDEPGQIFYYVFIILILPLFVSVTLYSLYFC